MEIVRVTFSGEHYKKASEYWVFRDRFDNAALVVAIFERRDSSIDNIEIISEQEAKSIHSAECLGSIWDMAERFLNVPYCWYLKFVCVEECVTERNRAAKLSADYADGRRLASVRIKS